MNQELIRQLSQESLAVPDTLDDVTVGDIPTKYFDYKNQVPVFGFAVDADYKDFKMAYKLCKEVKEIE